MPLTLCAAVLGPCLLCSPSLLWCAQVPLLMAVLYPPNADLQRWAPAWRTLGVASASGCGALVLSNSLLPMVTAAGNSSSSSNGSSSNGSSSSSSSGGSSSGGSSSSSPAVPLWMQDTSVSALAAECSDDTDALVRALQLSLASGLQLRAAVQAAPGTASLGTFGAAAAAPDPASASAAPQSPQQSSPPAAGEDAETAAIRVLDSLSYLLSSPSSTNTTNANGTTNGTASASVAALLAARYRGLTSALARCVPRQPSADGSAAGGLSRYAVSLPPTQMTLTVEEGGVQAGDGTWLLQAGGSLMASVALRDRFNQPVTSGEAGSHVEGGLGAGCAMRSAMRCTMRCVVGACRVVVAAMQI